MEKDAIKWEIRGVELEIKVLQQHLEFQKSKLKELKTLLKKA